MSTLLAIESIRRRRDARDLNDDVVSGLMESIEDGVLINPIMVRQVGDGYEAIAGGHRLAACDLLGHREIECNIVELDDLHAELAMIDENLFRAELSSTDRARQTARRKAIYLELHPETAHGANLEGAGVANLSTPETPAFASATAAVTGQSERAVRRDAERGEKVISEVMDMIRGTKLDTGVYLDKLKRLPPSGQAETARRDLHAAHAPNGMPRRYAGAGDAPPTTEAFDRFIRHADELKSLSIADVIAASGRQRSVLGQRASGIADRMGEIMEGLDR